MSTKFAVGKNLKQGIEVIIANGYTEKILLILSQRQENRKPSLLPARKSQMQRRLAHAENQVRAKLL